MAANKRRLMEMGMPAPLATELANQITAGVGDKRRLSELGMIGAQYVASTIPNKNCLATKLVERSFAPGLAREVATQINT